MSGNKKICRLYLELLEKYGSPEKYWPQWCSRNKSKRDRELVVMGMILVQRTSWHNAELALKNLLQADLLSIKKIAELPSHEPLIPLIRIAGFYQSKPKRLYDICRYAAGNSYSREELLKINGIGPETADTILLYAADQPTFIIDEYTKRFVEKHRLADDFDYTFLQKLFEENLPKDFRVYQDFHALIIFDQKDKKGWRMEKV